MLRDCDVCGVGYQAQRKSSKYCSTACRTRASRSKDGKVVDLPASGDAGLVIATKRELEAAGRLDTALGQQALALAGLIAAGHDSGSSIAALSKELRAVMDSALANVADAADPIDELRAWRDRKRVAAR